MHRYLVSLSLLTIGLFVGASIASAQWNSDLYIPRIGFPEEIDTIYGSKNQQNLGAGVINMGPKPGSPYGRIWLAGVKEGPVLYGISPYFEVEAGPNFKLKNLKSQARQQTLTMNRDWQSVPLANSKSRDLLVLDNGDLPTIYWEDSLGNYDNARKTRLLMEESGVKNSFNWYGYLMYNTFLSTDSVHDVISVVARTYEDSRPDSLFIAYYKGGSSLKLGDAYPSEVIPLLEIIPGPIGWLRYSTKGDWRGTGSEDLITADPVANAYFYYAAERPFSLQRFAESLLHDTLMTKEDEPRISSFVTGGITMKAYPKSSGDKSMDLVFTLIFKDVGEVIHFFKGHSEFGSYRLTGDSAKVTIKPFEGSLSDFYFDGSKHDMGDMTGTGNRLLHMSASQDGGFSTYHLFYVTGEALDDTADVAYFVQPRGRAWADTITANSDNLQDAILGIPDFYTFEDLDRGKINVGTVQVIYGSKRIAVKGHSSVATIDLAHSLNVYPNPSHGPVKIELEPVLSPNITLSLSDCMGRVIKSQDIPVIPGSLTTLITDYTDAAPGSYILSVYDGNNTYRTKLIILQTLRF